MGVLGRAADRLEKFDAAADAARDQFSTQALLNLALTAGLMLAIGMAVLALSRGGE